MSWGAYEGRAERGKPRGAEARGQPGEEATPSTLRLNAFLQELRRDLDEGRRPPIRDYLQRYEDIEEDVAREVLAARMAAPGGPASHRLGTYELLERIGRGGQGVVYRARDTRLGREVALKVLPVLEGADRQRWERFRREAAVASGLQHPGLCPVLDADFEDGRPFIAMPWIPGETLAVHIARAQAEKGGPPSRQAREKLLRIVEELARALHVAHEAGVVHRDVKPSNVIVRPTGEPVLVDFGLAKELLNSESTLTSTGDVLGTPAYMSPECIQGMGGGRSADIYSLGVILYESVTGRRPFEFPNRERLIHAILREEPEAPHRLANDVGRDLAAVIQTALAKLPPERYSTAQELASDMESARTGRPVSARPLSHSRRAIRWAKRKPMAAAFIFVAMIALVLAGYLGRRLQSEYVEAADKNYRLRLYRAAFLPEPGWDDTLKALQNERPSDLLPWVVLITKSMLRGGTVLHRLNPDHVRRARTYFEAAPVALSLEPAGFMLREILATDPLQFQSDDLPAILARTAATRTLSERQHLAYVVGFVGLDPTAVRGILSEDIPEASDFFCHRLISYISRRSPDLDCLRSATIAYALEPDDVGAVTTLATTIDLLPEKYRSKDPSDSGAVLRLCRRALSMSPDSAAVITDATYAMEGEVPGWECECESLYWRSLELDPDLDATRQNLKNLLRRTHKLTPDLRIALTEPILDTYGEWSTSWVDLGIGYRELGEPKKAIEALETGLGRVLPPGRREILGLLCEWYVEDCDFSAALEAWDKCYEEPYEDANGLESLWYAMDAAQDPNRMDCLIERTVQAQKNGIKLGEHAATKIAFVTVPPN